jgi:hypothetical protein
LWILLHAAHQIICKFGCDETAPIRAETGSQKQNAVHDKLLPERTPPILRDPHPRDLDHASAAASNHALVVRSREPSAHKVDYLPGRKTMRP